MSELSIKLEGFPEKVQRVADAIEDSLPGLISWVQGFDDTGDLTIIIEGFEKSIHALAEVKAKRCLNDVQQILIKQYG